MAIVSLVCGVVPVLSWLTIGLSSSWLVKIISLVCGTGAGAAAIVLGHTTRRRIQRARGTLGGSGIAMTGFVLGIVGVVICVSYLLIMAVVVILHGVLAPLTGT
jgi:hypothetical protein